MIGRYFLLFLGVVSLFWIGYVGLDILDKKDQFSPSHIFGIEDGRVLIINRTNECSLDELDFSLPVESAHLFNSLAPHLEEMKTIMLSELQNQLLFENKDNWSKERIVSLFKKAQLSVQFESRHSFKAGNFQGEYNHEILYLAKKEVKKNAQPNDEWLMFDHKSSASIVTFSKNKWTISDVYFKQNNCVEYLSQNSKNLLGHQIDDQELFADVLPNDLTDYHFYEKNYYSGQDKVFKKGPMFQWMENGFVVFNYKENVVIISDYIAGQNPIQLLNDVAGKSDVDGSEESGFFKDILLSKLFATQESEGFTIKMMEDFVVISASKSACEQVIADYKLGNTLAMKKDRLDSFYKDLPKKVSERSIQDKESYSRSIYKNKLLETRLLNKSGSSEETIEKPQEEKQTVLSLFVGGKIKHFIVLNGEGNVAALTENGLLQLFTSGKSNWKKNLEGEPIGEIQSVDFLGNGEKQFLCSTTKGVHCIDKQGNELNGFPIKLDVTPVQEASVYRWKGNGFVAIPSERGELLIFDSKGKKVCSLKSGLQNITEKVEVWVSQSILLAAVRDEKQCVLLNLDRKKEYRRFAIDGQTLAYKTRNELRQFSLKGGQLAITDQKGNKSNLAIFHSGKALTIFNDISTPTILIRTNDDLHLVNYQGKEFGTIHLPFGELDYTDVYSGTFGNYILVVDGLANNIYLYKPNGEKMIKNPLEGKTMSKLNFKNSNEFLITTIVDEYIIQYIEKQSLNN